MTPDLSRAVWRKSAKSSANGGCVEVADLGQAGVAIRDSKNPDGAVLLFTREEWGCFLDEAEQGEFRQG